MIDCGRCGAPEVCRDHGCQDEAWEAAAYAEHMKQLEAEHHAELERERREEEERGERA